MAYTKKNIKEVKFTQRDFSGIKTNLIEFAKNYFPNTVKDFTEASPSTMFIDMAAYVGDVLSYYTDYSMKETMLHRAQERKNVFAIAQSFGYKPKIATPSTLKLFVYTLIPSTGTGANVKPDWDYAPRVNKGMIVKSNQSIKFQTIDHVDFRTSSSYDPTQVSVYTTNESTGLPEQYLCSKEVNCVSGELRSEEFALGSADPYASIVLDSDRVQSIESIVDSDGNNWTEVPFLAQETVFNETVNSVANDPTLSANSNTIPYVLSLKSIGKRFITRVTPDNRIKIQFGAGISSDPDEEIIPNPQNVGSSLPGGVNNLNKSFDPSNFLYTNTYGEMPSNTTLTVTYLHGYGLRANVGTNEVTDIVSKTITFPDDKTLVKGTIETVQNSIYVANVSPATGGSGPETIEQVRQNALGFFNTQNRVVTKEDYVIRALSMPAKFGSIAKAWVASDEQMTKDHISVSNPLAINLYVLTYDRSKKLTQPVGAAKENLRTYMSQYRMLTDAINIKNGYIVNIGINFKITVLSNQNSNKVLLKTISALKEKYQIDNFTFGSVIYLKDIYLCIANVEGVQSVIDVEVVNKFGGAYSKYRYNIEDATMNDVIFPSLDPSCFEIKFPNDDIQGQVIQY